MSWFGDAKRGRIGAFFGNDPTIVGYWQLNGSTQDNSGKGNAGTLVSPGTYKQGKFGLAFSTPGTSAAAITTPTAGIPRAFPFTLMAWIRPTPSANYQSIISLWNGFGSGAGWALYVNPSANLYFQSYSGGTGSAVASTATLSSGVMYFVAVVAQAGTAYFYVNGVFTNSAAITDQNPTVTQPLEIGNSNSDNTNGQNFIGTIEEALIASRAVPANQISQYYAWATKKKASVLQKVLKLAVSYTLTAAQGVYTMTGEAATTLKGSLLTAATGTYIVWGETTSFLKNLLLSAAYGVYSYVGHAVTLARAGFILELKNALSWVLESRADLRLWDDATSTWDDPIAKWDSQLTSFGNENKNMVSLTYEPKNY